MNYSNHDSQDSAILLRQLSESTGYVKLSCKIDCLSKCMQNLHEKT